MLKCKISKNCGGCQLLDKTYEDTLNYKLNYVNECLKQEGINYKINDIYRSVHDTEYRNKMIVSFKMVNGVIKAGFYEENSHKVIPMEHCIMHSENQNKIVNDFASLMKIFKLAPYNEDKRTGFIRYLLIKEAHKTKELMVVIVTSLDNFPGSKELCKKLVQNNPNIKSVIQNINSRKTSLVLGDKEKVLYGSPFIIDYLCGLKFQITSKSFFQVNPEQAENLYNQVLNYASLTGNEVVIDAYSGIGTIGLYLSENAKEVISVENNKQAHNSAIMNAKINNIKNTFFYNDDATKFINELAKMKEHIDVIIMDPPRTGSTIEFINACIKLQPKKIVYVSCGPDTLARDLKYFYKGNYEIKKASCFDMFCYTKHVESIVLLTSENKLKNKFM